MTQVALVGCAHIHTPGFIKRMNARSDVSVKYVWDHDADRAGKRANELSAQTVTDLAQIWTDNDITGVIVCSETDRHEPLVLAAAENGKHMFVEKPLGLGSADAYRMAAHIEQAGVLFQTGYFQRGHPISQFVRQQIQQGGFGKVTRIRLTNCHGGSLGDWFTPEWLWMTDPQQAGGGGFGDLGTHALDLMLWMMGNPTSVTAGIEVATGRYGPDCDEYGEGLLKFGGGAIGSLAAGWVDVAHPVNLIVSGTEGHAHVDGGKLYFKSNHVEGASGESPWTDLPAEWPHAFELFLDALGGKEDIPLVEPKEAAVRSAVMEALYAGAEAGKWISPTGPV